MSNLLWLSERRMKSILNLLPKPRGKSGGDDRQTRSVPADA